MKKQGFLYGSAVLIFSALIVKIIGAMFRIPLANMLGGTGMGYFSAAYGIFMPVYAISVTGLPTAAARAVSAGIALGRENEAQAVRQTALRLFGAVGIAGSLIIIVGAYPLCRFVSGDILALPAILAIAPSVLAGCLVSVYRGCCEGMRDMYPTAVSQVIEGIAKLLFGLALCGGCIYLSRVYPEAFMKITGCRVSSEEAVLPYAAAAAVLGVTLSSFSSLIYLAVREKRTKMHVSVPKTHTKQMCRELLKTAVPAAVGALVINLTSVIDLVTIMRSLKHLTANSPWIFSNLLGAGISYEQMPNFIYGSFTGLAVTLFNLVPSLTNMLGKSMLPQAAAAKASGNMKRLGECAFGVIFACALICVPAGIGMASLSEEILTVLFSEHLLEISVCCKAMTVLGFSVMFVCISSSAFAVLQAADRADIPVKLMAAGAVIKLAGNLILTAQPKLNVTGAAIATLLCYAFICVMSLAALNKYTNMNVAALIKKLIVIIFASLCCAAAALFSVNYLLVDKSMLVRTCFSCLLGGVIYILITYFSGIITKSTLKMLIS